MALVPLLAAVSRSPRCPARRGFGLGLATGAVSFAGTMYWTPEVMATFGDINGPLSVAIGGLLIAYLALYPGLFGALQAAACGRWGRRALWLAPAFWVATELLRRYVLSGFPWVLLGYSQAPVVPVVQVASVAGVYGLSALVMVISVALTFAIVGRGRERLFVPVSGVALGLLIAAVGWWRVQDGHLAGAGTPVRVALVQGNIPQDQKWDAGHATRILQTYLSMSRDAAAAGAQLVVWPESATPFYYDYDAVGNAAIRDLVRTTGIHLLFGTDQFDPGPPRRIFNAALMLAPSGLTTAAYHKMHLVPFGEYVPMKRLLFFAAPLVEAVSDFSPGTEPVVMAMGRHRLSTAICYEVVYPDLIGTFTARGSQLLTTITNDAWYGRTSAPHQHFWQAVVRAVEQGRFLVRAANTGISGIVDPYGRVVAQSPLFERMVVQGDVRFIDERTIYGRTGDAFAWACAAVAALAAALLYVESRRGGASR